MNNTDRNKITSYINILWQPLPKYSVLQSVCCCCCSSSFRVTNNRYDAFFENKLKGNTGTKVRIPMETFLYFRREPCKEKGNLNYQGFVLQIQNICFV